MSRRLGGVTALLVSLLTALSTLVAQTQPPVYERTFSQSKPAVLKALNSLQPQLAGRLPVLEGFAAPGDNSLERYQRGYYQATFELSAAPSGGSIVRFTAKITAWYSDPSGAHSGYQLLKSNGRIESDLFDQLSAQLGSNSSPSSAALGVTSPAASTPPPAKTTQSKAAEPTIPVPSAKFPNANPTLSASLSHGLAPHENATPEETAAAKAESSLAAEADNLQSMLKNIAHPNNLVAVKKSGTPVVATPSLSAKPEFLASMHDEFELLDFNADWVHVRISGLSRGWIWRDSVEMPGGIPDTADHFTKSQTPAADLFHVSREETAQFPGDWEPLRNKSVKIISVQKVDSSAKATAPKERLEYAKFLLDKSYAEISEKPQDLQGIVVIFDSADGGMIAATLATLQQWKAGGLTDAAMWHQCFFDPPEIFDSAASGSK